MKYPTRQCALTSAPSAHAVHCSGDKVHIVDDDADPHKKGAQRHERQTWQQSVLLPFSNTTRTGR
jgi:hypothetical protein